MVTYVSQGNITVYRSEGGFVRLLIDDPHYQQNYADFYVPLFPICYGKELGGKRQVKPKARTVRHTYILSDGGRSDEVQSPDGHDRSRLMTDR